MVVAQRLPLMCMLLHKQNILHGGANSIQKQPPYSFSCEPFGNQTSGCPLCRKNASALQAKDANG